MNPSPRILPSQEYLKSVLSYCPETGEFKWLPRANKRGIRDGAKTGYTDNLGYLRINLQGTPRLAHRIAWVMVHGECLSTDIDHINGNPSDNRLSNLRAATHTQNQRNQKLRKDNTSGHKGVYWCAALKKWAAYINHGGKMRIIGYFREIEAAAQARQNTEREVFQEFARKIDAPVKECQQETFSLKP